MEKHLGRRWRRVVLGVVLAAGVVLLTLPALEAISVQPVKCTGKKDHIIKLLTGQTFLAQTDGFLTVGIGDSAKLADGRKTTALTVDDVFSQGTAEGLGEVTFEDDPDRKGGESSLVANQKGRPFPATQTVRFHFTMSLDGHLYRSINPAVVTSTCVNDLPPPAGTVYTLVERVALEDMQSPGKVALTIEPGKAFTSG
jgi:hypothetical protein